MKAPVQIGRLQRFACDTASERGVRFFEPVPPTGKRIAVIGSGPAGLSCAHELRRLGHDVVVFEARDVPGRPRYAGHRRLQNLDRVRSGRNRDDSPDRHRHRVRPPRHRRPRCASCWRRLTPCSSVSAWGELFRWESKAKSSRERGRRSNSSSRLTPKPLHRMQSRRECGGDRRGQHGDRRGNSRQTARRQDCDDRLPAFGSADTGFRLRVRARTIRWRAV